MVEIALTPEEIEYCWIIGRERRNTGKEKAGTFGIDNEKATVEMDFLSVAAECAVAKHCDVYYNGNLGDFFAADAGLFQVRSTEWPNGCLCVHPEDKDHEVFVLAITNDVIERNVVKLEGWMYGYEAKAGGTKNNPLFYTKQAGRHPAFWIPQRLLWLAEDLPRSKARRGRRAKKEKVDGRSLSLAMA